MRSLMKATAVALIAVGSLTACQSEEAAQSAVAVGGDFQFHSPGGKTIIHYAEDERQSLANFGGEDLMNEGEQIELDDFKGQIVVLNAWGQWCAPCRSEVDDLQRVQEELQESGTGTVLGINVKDYQRTAAQDFVTDNGVTYPSIYDPPFRSALALGGVPSSVIPTTVILDKQHRPAAVFLQGVSDTQVLEVTRKLEQEA